MPVSAVNCTKIHSTSRSYQVAPLDALGSFTRNAADGLERFARFSPTMFFTERIARRVGTGCCTPKLISMHYLLPWEIRWFYETLYLPQDATAAPAHRMVLS
jgi:hypothetical protein